MHEVSLAAAKACLSELIDYAATLRAVMEGMAPQTEAAGDFMRRMRDEERH